MTRLAFAGVSCVRGGRLLFEDRSFDLAPGDAALVTGPNGVGKRSEEHTSELQSLMRISYAVFCLKKKKKKNQKTNICSQAEKEKHIEKSQIDNTTCTSVRN